MTRVQWQGKAICMGSNVTRESLQRTIELVPIQMFGARVFLAALGRWALILLVAGLHHAPLFARLHLVRLLVVVVYLYFRLLLLILILRAPRVVWALSSRRGSFCIDVAHHGRALSSVVPCGEDVGGGEDEGVERQQDS